MSGVDGQQCCVRLHATLGCFRVLACSFDEPSPHRSVVSILLQPTVDIDVSPFHVSRINNFEPSITLISYNRSLIACHSRLAGAQETPHYGWERTIKGNLHFKWCELFVYSYFEKGCRKKCTRQTRKALWVDLNSLFFREIWKNWHERSWKCVCEC